ncbi:MAG: glycosyltransferase, partial [Elusimicrobiota bacterium]|nr:glycosyltransferase [Endomicrobiia bacterium]MDW8166656.1 glycosyltransferase [Elusimicrobiota bacterium]
MIKYNKRIRFLIVGDGPLLNYLKNNIANLGLENYFIFTGFRVDIDNLYSQSYVGPFPCNTHAGMVEAVKYIPLVAGKGQVQKEYVIGGETGFLCEDNIDDYIEKLNHLLYDNNMYDNLKQNSIKLFYSKLCLQNGIDKFINLYKKTYAITPNLPGGTRHFDFGKELIKRRYKVAIFASSFHYSLLKETKEYNKKS